MSDLHIWIALSCLLAIIGLVHYVHHRYKLAQKILASQKATTRLGAWLANYFGTFREYEYEPLFPKKETEDIIDFLSGVNHSSARELSLIAEHYLDSGSVPREVHGDEAHFRSAHIHNCCQAVQRRQLA